MTWAALLVVAAFVAALCGFVSWRKVIGGLVAAGLVVFAATHPGEAASAVTSAAAGLGSVAAGFGTFIEHL